MPVNTSHPDYNAALAAWVRARDVIAGEDAVKLAGGRYLSRLDGQTEEDFKAYVGRTCFFNATSRTLDGFLGLLFRQEPVIKCGTRSAERGAGNGGGLDGFLQDVDLAGTSLPAYCKAVTREVLAVGRAGTLVDWNEGAEARACVVLYHAEDIINWQTTRLGGRTVLALVVLREVVAVENPADGFAPVSVEQYRVLRLVEGECVVEVWRKGTPGAESGAPAEWQVTERRRLRRWGRPLAFIPFVFHSPRHSLPQVEKSPLADIINTNLDHYRLDADYKHGLHWTALPTAFVSGFDTKNGPLKIGATTAWTTETVGATAGFLEFKGQGLGSFVVAKGDDERHMALLGSRMLEDTKRVGETAAAIELRQAGENSVLMTLAISLSEGLTQVLRMAVWWHAHEATPELVGPAAALVSLNKDFTARGLASNELVALVSSWQAGAISQETLFDSLRRGEVLPAGRTDEEEARLISRKDAEAQRGEPGSSEQ